MKRWIAILVALVLALSLTACGGAATEPKEEPKPSEPIQTDTGTPALPNEPTEPTKPAEPAEPAEPERDYVLEHNVVVDDENCLFVITGMEEDYGEIVFNVYVENRTDLTLMFALDNVLINGYLNDPYWATEVAPGKKANSAFTFDKDTLKKYDLLPIDELRFTLRAYDSDDWSADDLLNDIFTVYPTGMNGEIVKRP
ncbi:MAG: hypothetical protein II069_02490, partial [Oscillospiraceae bacterium]|nr:hypothetical protein [Oscillospiraceae bacterium]